METRMQAPPVLSTPETHILNDTSTSTLLHQPHGLSEEQLELRYEISRTVREIKEHGWRRVALQFPDEMLQHSARVYQRLARGLEIGALASKSGAAPTRQTATTSNNQDGVNDIGSLSLSEGAEPCKLTILGDTSYGSCCVDEIAAEHVDADAVVHYGRACLSPPARLPVVHVFTERDLDHAQVVASLAGAYPDRATRVILMADVPYAKHVQNIQKLLTAKGYVSVFPTEIIHNPASSIPNRTIPTPVRQEQSSLKEWHLFHIAEPQTSLLLTLAASMASIKVYPAEHDTTRSDATSVEQTTSVLLRRRYALVTSLSTVAVWGILINTLSVKNYLHMVEHVKSQVAEAGKKSYLFVVGKINAAKVANFSEIGGWVVIGCWESSLIDSKDFYKPIITPYELELALSPDSSRIWSGKWRSDFDSVFEASRQRQEAQQQRQEQDALTDDKESLSDDESEPPEFDLRTGRYVSKTRPMGRSLQRRNDSRMTGGTEANSNRIDTLTKRSNGDIVSVNGTASPAADFLAGKRTWRGLGSDFEIRYDDEEPEGALLEEGLAGIARSYGADESGKT